MGKPGNWGFVFWFGLVFGLIFVVAGAEPMDGPAVMNPPDPPPAPEDGLDVVVFVVWFVVWFVV